MFLHPKLVVFILLTAGACAVIALWRVKRRSGKSERDGAAARCATRDVWLSLFFVVIFLGMLSIFAIVEASRRGQVYGLFELLGSATLLVYCAPAAPLLPAGWPAAGVGATVFWGALLVSAVRSGEARFRRLFFFLLGGLVVVVTIGLLALFISAWMYGSAI